MRSLSASGRLRSVGADGNNGRRECYSKLSKFGHLSRRRNHSVEFGVESHAEMVMLTLVDAPPAQESLDFGRQICLKRLAM